MPKDMREGVFFDSLFFGDSEGVFAPAVIAILSTFLLQEDGFYLLQEDGSKIIL